MSTPTSAMMTVVGPLRYLGQGLTVSLAPAGTQLALCAVSRKAGILCRPFSSTPKDDGTGVPEICGVFAWMKAGRISSISQYFETASRSSSSVASLGLGSMSGGKAPVAKTSTKEDAPGAAE